MRKRKSHFYKPNLMYLLFWVILVICFFGIQIFSFSIPNLFQNIGVFFGKPFAKQEIDLKRYDQELINELRKENALLREMLDYKESNVDYSIISASVIFRNVNWQDTLIIDSGTKNGVSTDMSVVTEDGLIGYIKEVYQDSSLVQLLTDPINQSKVAVSILSGGNEITGILDHYDTDSNNFYVTCIRKQDNIEIGSSVITNGLGNKFPSRIPVGTVKEVTTDPLGVSTILKIEPSVDFDQLGYVLILGK